MSRARNDPSRRDDAARSRTRRELWSLRGPYGLIALGGAVMGLCWLPFALGPLMPVGAAFAIAGIEAARTRREAWIAGVVFGASRYLVASHFLLALAFHHWSAAVFYPMAVLYVLPQSWAEAAVAWWMDRRLGIPRGIGLAITYSITERLRTIGDTSFPADLLSHAFGDSPQWLAWNSAIGPFGFTLLVGVTGFCVVRTWRAWRSGGRAAAWALSVAILWGGPPLTDLVLRPGTEPAGRPLRVAMIQPFVKGPDKLDRERWPALQAKLERMSREAVERGADLLLWPETTRPGPLVWAHDAAEGDPLVQSLADDLGAPVLYGTEIARLDESGIVVRLYNGAAIVHPGAPERFQWYGKQRLLPFVEGVPFAERIGWDPARAAREGTRRAMPFLGNFYKGPATEPFEVGDARLGVLICYEGFYPALARRWRLAGANALVLLTNDGWWGRSTFAPWHAKMLATRARELDLPIARAANSGISTVFDARGRRGPRTEWLSEGVTVMEWFPSAGGRRTLWSRAPDAIFLTVLIVVAAVGRATRRRAT